MCHKLISLFRKMSACPETSRPERSLLRKKGACPNNKKPTLAGSVRQSGNMIVMAMFIIVVIGMLASALIKIVSSSSESIIHQVYGLRAHQAAKAGIQVLLRSSFPAPDSAVSCNQTISSPASMAGVNGLQNCSYSATCSSETINFANVDYLYFKYTSTGNCQVNNSIVSRTLSVDAMEEVSP